MKWKCGLAGIVLSLAAVSGVNADFIQVDDTVLTVPKNTSQSIHADFKEGNKVVRFAAGRTPDGAQSILAMVSRKHVDWKITDDLPRPSSYQAYMVKQFKDTDTNRYYYGITCFFTMDATYHAYLVGYDKNGTKAEQYIDSDDFPNGKRDNVNISVSGRNLVLYTKKDRESSTQIYQLNWSEENQWFGYEYMPGGTLEKPAYVSKPARQTSDVNQLLQLSYFIPFPGAPARFSQDVVDMKVGQKLYISVAKGSVDPGYTRWMNGSNYNNIFDLIDAESKGETFPKGSTELLVTAVKPGTGVLKVIPGYGEFERAANVMIRITE